MAAAVAQGYGKVLRYTGIEDIDRAHAIRRGIYRCTKHRGITADAGPSGRVVEGADEMGVHKNGGEYEVWYRVWSKYQARKRHLARYGADRSKWPYDPRRGATPDERNSWANKDETGRPVLHD